MKMLVSGAGDIKLTKDGNVLLHEMSLNHPTASLIAKAATAQDDITGDGTTSNVLLIGELLKQAQDLVDESTHPRQIAEGFELAKEEALKCLDAMKVPLPQDEAERRERLIHVAQTSLNTKVNKVVAGKLTEIVVDAVLAISKDKSQPINLHMVEIMDMKHKLDVDTSLVQGVVMDHGARHPDMPKRVENAYILTCNVSMEYEKSEVNSGFFYKSAEEREKLVAAERRFTDDKVNKVIALKKQVCDAAGDGDRGFVVINQKGIDPMSLDMLAKAGIVALRRAKRRNMERLMLACGGSAMNSVEDLTPDCLGHAGLVYEHVLGESKYTYVEKCQNAKSVTILIKGPNKHTITQIKDAVRDGLRAVKNAIEDDCVVAGAGGFQIAAYNALMKYKGSVKGRARQGVKAFAEALLIIPKTLARNAGLDQQKVIEELMDNYSDPSNPVGVDLKTGDAILPLEVGIVDNYIVMKQLLSSCMIIASNLLLVDEMMRAGMATLKSG